MNAATEVVTLDEDDNLRKSAALDLARRGFAILAIDKRSKEPDRLLAPNGFSDATRDAETIGGWFDAKPNANMAVACGPDFGIIVLDIDCKNGAPGFDTWSRLGIAAVTLSATTPSGGLHLYFQHPKAKLFASLPGINIKGADGGGYVLAPPSTLPNYGNYSWADPDIPVAEFPADLLRQLRVDEKVARGRKKLRREAATGESEGPTAMLKVRKGERHDRLIALGGAFRGKGLEEDEIEACLWVRAETDFDPPFSRSTQADVREIARITHWYADKPTNAERSPDPPPEIIVRSPLDLARPDLAHPQVEPVERLVRLHGQRQEDRARLQRLAREIDRAHLFGTPVNGALALWRQALEELEEEAGLQARELDLAIELLEHR